MDTFFDDPSVWDYPGQAAEWRKPTPTPRQWGFSETCSFLGLPPEVRHRIYALAVPTDKHLVISKRSCFDMETREVHDMKSTSPLLATCKPIRAETIAMFYSTIQFILWVWQPERWLDIRSLDSRTHLRTVRVNMLYCDFLVYAP